MAKKPKAVVLGVGAERGVGAGLSRRFAKEGYHVLVAGRTAAKIEKVVETIRTAGGSATAVVTDGTREADVVALFDRAMADDAEGSPADLLVFNMGNNQAVDFREMTAQHFEDSWRVGCFAGFLFAREFGPQGIHVAHVIIDGGIEGERLLSRMPDRKDKAGPDGLLGIEAIVENYWHIHRQPRSAWSHEIDLRPYKESF